MNGLSSVQTFRMVALGDLTPARVEHQTEQVEEWTPMLFCHLTLNPIGPYEGDEFG